MLDDVSSTTGLDFNYNVTVYSNDTTSVVGTPISVTAATVLQTKTLVERTIQVFSSWGSNNSYVTISMEVIAPIWEDGGTAAFMDAQYAGYIVAELKFTWLLSLLVLSKYGIVSNLHADLICQQESSKAKYRYG